MLPPEEIPLRIRAREFLVQKVFSRLLAVLEDCEAPFFHPWRETPAVKKGGGAVLMMIHAHGGGAEKQAEREAAQLARDGRETYFLRFLPLQRRFVLSETPGQDGRRKSYFMPWQWGALARKLKALGIAEMRLHHARYWPDYAVRELPELAKSLGAAFNIALHDYAYICPRITLLDGDYRYCGAPADAAVCETCVSKNGSLIRHPGNVGRWRQRQFAFLKTADGLIAPSFDAAARYGKIFSGIGIMVKPHEGTIAQAPSLSSMIPSHGLRIAVMGNLLRHKGADCVLEAARFIKAQKLPIEIRVIGHAVYRPELARLGISMTGRYDTEDQARHLRAAAPDYVWLASPWPETYSFVLSEAWGLGYPVIAFDLGAQAERIRKQGGRNRLLPLKLAGDISALCEALLQLRAS